MSDLSVVILCGQSPRHIYFANKVCEAGKPLAIIQEAGHNFSLKKLFKLVTDPKKLWRKVSRRLRDRKNQPAISEREFFFGENEPQFEQQQLQQQVPHINHPDVVRIVDEHQPDLICVFGTSLIKGELLEKGRLGIINLHGGLSPEYRGADCTFWALHNAEPEKVGCTVHYINAGIDTGKLIAHISPEVNERDDEFSLFWKAVKDSADHYGELLERMEKGEKFGVTQTDKGRLYQVKDRLPENEQRLQELLEKGLLQGIHLEQRIHWFIPE